VQRSVKLKLPLSTQRGPCGSAYSVECGFLVAALRAQLPDRFSDDSHMHRGHAAGAALLPIYRSRRSISREESPASGEDFGVFAVAARPFRLPAGGLAARGGSVFSGGGWPPEDLRSRGMQ
jgi:hypothetical protein